MVGLRCGNQIMHIPHLCCIQALPSIWLIGEDDTVCDSRSLPSSSQIKIENLIGHRSLGRQAGGYQRGESCSVEHVDEQWRCSMPLSQANGRESPVKARFEGVAPHER